jgi:hypothetical protein
MFSKLDMRSWYHQLTLASESYYFTMFATHMGLKLYTHLNFGTNSAHEIFQEVVNELIHNLSPSHCEISPRMIVSSNGPRSTTKLSTKSNICSLIQKPWHIFDPNKEDTCAHHQCITMGLVRYFDAEKSACIEQWHLR